MLTNLTNAHLKYPYTRFEFNFPDFKKTKRHERLKRRIQIIINSKKNSERVQKETSSITRRKSIPASVGTGLSVSRRRRRSLSTTDARRVGASLLLRAMCIV